MSKQFFRNETNNHDTRLVKWGHEKVHTQRSFIPPALPRSGDKKWNKEQMYRNVETRPGLNSSSCHLTQSREASIKGNSIVKLWLNYFAEGVRRGQKPSLHICGAATETRWNANCLNDTVCYSPPLSREKLLTLARWGVETQMLW